MSSDWWSRRLGGNPPPPQPAGYQQQVVYPGQQQYPQPQQYQVPQQAPKVTIGNLVEAMGHWRGGEGERNTEPCPKCGGFLFRRKQGVMEAAPLCYGCGWNPLWEQALPGNWSSPA